MFHFPTFPPPTLCVQVRVTGHDSSWVSPFGHPRITARLPTPRGLSQAPTSFIGSWCQGIHHVPLVACLNNVKTTQLQRPTTTPQSKAWQQFDSYCTSTLTRHQPPKAGNTREHGMLASTIQISNNNPTNPSTHHRALQRRRTKETSRTNHPTRAIHPDLIPQDPTACHDPPPPAIHPGSTPPHTSA